MVKMIITVVLTICMCGVYGRVLNAGVVEDALSTLQQNINLVQDGRIVSKFETVAVDYPDHPVELMRKGTIQHGKKELSFKGKDQIRLQNEVIDEGPEKGLVQTQFAAKGITVNIRHTSRVAEIFNDNRTRSQKFYELEYERIPGLVSSYNINLIGEKSVNGITLFTLEFIPKDISTPGIYSRIEVDLEPGKNYSVRRIRYEKNGKIIYETSYDDYRLVNGKIWWPYQVMFGLYEEIIKGKEPQLWTKITSTVETIGLNIGLSDSYFEPQIPQGFHVSDSIAGINYQKE